MNILYFSPIRLLPLGHGNIATVHQYIRRLKNLGHKVHYVFLNDDSSLSKEDIFCAQDYVDTLDVLEDKAEIYRDSSGYFKFDSKYFQGLGENIRYLCEIYNVQIVICTYIFHSKILEWVPKDILKIIDTHDRMTDRHLFLKVNKIKDEFFSCTQEDEAKYLNRADIIWARRDQETRFFNEITNSNKCLTVSHFDEPNFLPVTSGNFRLIGFLASDNNVNFQMVKEFVYVFIRKYAECPIDIKLVIGGNVEKLIKKDRKFLKLCSSFPIKFTGFVENKEEFYNNVDAVIVPITFGTGINVKMIEAMSFGKPIISTRIGIKGIVSDSRYHNAKSLSDLVERIWELYKKKEDLFELAETSKQCYREFYRENTRNFDLCFGHWSLLSKKQDYGTACSGCGICVAACVRNASRMEENERGFFRPVKNNNCNECSTCDVVCPLKHRPEQLYAPRSDIVFGSYYEIYAAYSIDEEIRNYASTAGFIRTFLFDNINKFDGVISITDSDNYKKPELSLFKNCSELLKGISKSKYFPVEFSKIRDILKRSSGKYIIVGLPCHIAALKNAKRYFRAQFFTIELFCNGVFSFKLLDKYCRNSQLDVKALDFRDKITGWHDFSLTVVGKDNERKSTKASEDIFFLAQRNKIFTQESCLNCSYAYNGTADIQVGDFWGGKFSKDEKGINLVIARTKEAKELIEESIHLSCSCVSITEVYKSQPWFVNAYRRNIPNNKNMPCSETSIFKHELNEKFFDEYINYKNFQDLANLIKIHKFRKNDNKNNKILIVPSDDHCGSFGDQAMLLTLVGEISKRKPGVDIGLFMLYQSTEDGFLLNNGFNIEYHMADGFPIDKRFANVLDDYEQVVFIGADILDGGCGVETSKIRFAMMQIASSQEKKVSIMGFSFNRTTDQTIINGIRQISKFAQLYVRDSFSYNRLKNIGCSNLHLVADMAFSFNENNFQLDKPTMDLVEQLSFIRGGGRKILGVHITCSRTKSFIEFFEKIVAVLIDLPNVLVVLLPHDLRILEDKYPDIFVNEYLEESLRKKGINVLNASFLPNETAVKAIIPLIDVIVSSRMHLAIASLSRNVPVLSFVYQDKFEGLYNFYNFKVQTMFESDTFDVCTFKESLSYMLDNDHSSMIKEYNKKVKELSLKNFSFLDK